jgi:rubrerythrin
MPLTNFGAVLTFAEQLEQEDMAFYSKAASAAGSTPLAELFANLAKENKKNVALVQRTRRENVTEMILEPIRDFSRAPYELKVEDLAGPDSAAATSLENRAIGYYRAAAEKMRALPEVARALKMLAKKRGKRLERIERGDQ